MHRALERFSAWTFVQALCTSTETLEGNRVLSCGRARPQDRTLPNLLFAPRVSVRMQSLRNVTACVTRAVDLGLLPEDG
jgi:hypothetical protein